MRDHQRGKCYKAEGEASNIIAHEVPTEMWILNLTDDNSYESSQFHRRMLAAVAAMDGCTLFDIKFIHPPRHSTTAGFYRPADHSGRPTLNVVNRRFLYTPTLVHELAHHLSSACDDGGLPHTHRGACHDWKFAEVMCTLWGHVYGDRAEGVLRERYDHHGVLHDSEMAARYFDKRLSPEVRRTMRAWKSYDPSEDRMRLPYLSLTFARAVRYCKGIYSIGRGYYLGYSHGGEWFSFNVRELRGLTVESRLSPVFGPWTNESWDEGPVPQVVQSARQFVDANDERGLTTLAPLVQ